LEVSIGVAVERPTGLSESTANLWNTNPPESQLRRRLTLADNRYSPTLKSVTDEVMPVGFFSLNGKEQSSRLNSA
jgi:hypothetical protein